MQIFKKMSDCYTGEDNMNNVDLISFTVYVDCVCVCVCVCMCAHVCVHVCVRALVRAYAHTTRMHLLFVLQSCSNLCSIIFFPSSSLPMELYCEPAKGFCHRRGLKFSGNHFLTMPRPHLTHHGRKCKYGASCVA